MVQGLFKHNITLFIILTVSGLSVFLPILLLVFVLIFFYYFITAAKGEANLSRVFEEMEYVSLIR